jgi:3-dehydro-L-gulonate 2-dehydrogenase
MIRISFDEMCKQYVRVLLKVGFEEEKAKLCARLFAETALDGIYSHGLNRFPRFIDNIKDGYIKVNIEPTMVKSFGAIEQWDGNLGAGNLNAHFSMNRAIELAKENGIGCVALKNTNHWMRGGTYGWQAANANCVGICWTNTIANLPPWGGIEPKLGNNPIVLAVPREKGNIVIDVAISQYSYGQLTSHMLSGKQLEVPGGYDREGNITKDPNEVMETQRSLPIGFWKGSGLSMLLDMISVLLSGGKSTYEISKDPIEHSLNQIFIAFDMSKIQEDNSIYKDIENIVESVHSATPIEEGTKVRCPGEGALKIRKDNLENGIPVNEEIWNTVLNL